MYVSTKFLLASCLFCCFFSVANEVEDEDLRDLYENQRTVHLSTVVDGKPFSSSAPFVINFPYLYCLLSDTVKRGLAGKQNTDISLSIAEDEAKAKNILERKSVRLGMVVNEVPETEQKEWDAITAALIERFGEDMHKMTSYSDFRLYRFEMKGIKGRIFKGFARSYDFDELNGKGMTYVHGGHKEKDKTS